MKKFILFIAGLLTFSFLLAHEFWLHPNKFIYDWGEPINIRLMVGENYEGENWTGSRSSIQSLQLHLDDATDDLADRITDSTGDSLQFAIYDEGTYLLTYNSHNKFIELEAQKFLDYLKEDGLQNAIAYRANNNENDSAGREYYQRSVKTIFQVGSKTSKLFQKETNLPLDIIPLQNPYNFKPSDTIQQITVKLLFRKKPLANQLVKIWHRENNETQKIELQSNEKGLVQFPLKPSGRWMVSTVKMERLQNDPKAQWQSYWGSCTWGYE
jgi:uncharacterized GH25 family protein